MRIQAGDRDSLAAARFARNFASKDRPARFRRCLGVVLTAASGMCVVTRATVKLSAGEEHREIFHSTAGGEKFRLAGEGESNFVHASLMNGTGYDRVDLSRQSEFNGFFQRDRRDARARRGRLA